MPEREDFEEEDDLPLTDVDECGEYENKTPSNVGFEQILITDGARKKKRGTIETFSP